MVKSNFQTQPMGFPTQPDSSSQDVAVSESATLRDQRKSTFTDEVGDIGDTSHTGTPGPERLLEDCSTRL